MSNTIGGSMSDGRPVTPPPAVNDCWHKTGVRGDSSCPALQQHIHCRNCPTYATAAVRLLDRELPADYLREWTAHVSVDTRATKPGTKSVVIFRIGVEWLALPTSVFQEVAEQCRVHTLPHRRGGILLGLVNIRGELLLCVSLDTALGLEKAAAEQGDKTRMTYRRLLVVNREGSRLAFPVDEVSGVHRYHPCEVKERPATLAKATATYTVGLLSWKNITVGCLDDELLFYSLNENFS